MAKVTAAANDLYTFFQKTQQGAIDLAAATGTVQGYLSNVDGNNHFTVGTTTGAVAMSVNAATSAA